jgi:hypothetical protein
VTAPAKQTAAATIVLADREKTSCYLLGPTLLTGHDVTADASTEKTTAEWVVDVHFGTDDFVRKVASVEVNRQVAVIVEGVVESAPKVDPGITGRDVTIAGAFDEATARRVAAEIDPSSASRTPVTPTTTVIDTFAPRCSAVGPRLGFDPMATTSMITVATARSALERAHEPVPPWLASLDGSGRLALCEFTATTPTTGVTPTTVCPNGDVAEVGPSPPVVMYAVDANETAARLPGMQYLLPPGVTVPPRPGPCVGLGAP